VVAPKARTAPQVREAGNWRALVASFAWDVGTALRIIQCESRGNPNARNPRSSARGLFQILGGPLDPEANVRLAFSMYSSRGWQPWNASRGCWG
jgi:soluble lytic murein transglycosylase-like protein